MLLRRALLPSIAVGLSLVLPSLAAAENRSFNGLGNNQSNPTWGSAGTDFLRVGPAA